MPLQTLSSLFHCLLLTPRWQLHDANHADAVERMYAINWLTDFISHLGKWLELAPGFDDTPSTREAFIQLTFPRVLGRRSAVLRCCHKALDLGSFLIHVNDDAPCKVEDQSHLLLPSPSFDPGIRYN